MRQNFSSASILNGRVFAARKPLGYFFKAVFWIVIVLIGFELYLRTFVYGQKYVPVYDPEWGRRPVAGSTVLFRSEGNGITYYAADGEIATPYQGGANITVLGDSQTEAFQVNDGQKFVSIAEMELRARGRSIDLRNLGLSGGTLADYAYWAHLLQPRFQPGIVVIQLSAQDFSGSEGYNLSYAGNYFAKNADGTVKLVHQPTAENYSSLWKILVRFRGVAFLGYGQERINYLFLNSGNSQVPAEASQPQAAAGDSPTENLDVNYGAQLKALHTAYQGERVIILALPFSPQLGGDQIVLEDKAYHLLLDQVRQFKDWQVVDPLPAFQQLWLQEHKLPRGFTNSKPGIGHLNVDGHALVGKLLADKIEEMMR